MALGQKYYRRIFVAAAVMALLVAVCVLISTVVLQLPPMFLVLAIVGAIGWLVVSTLLLYVYRIYIAVSKTVSKTGLSNPEGSPETLIDDFTNQASRFHRAAFGARNEKKNEARGVSASLRKVLGLVFTELNTAAVELSLFEEGSERWTQSMLLGEPKSIHTLAMFSEDKHWGSEVVRDELNNLWVLIQPIVFSGTVFGVLRVEFPPGVAYTDNDLKVIALLADQAAIVLLDSQFAGEVIRLKRLSEETTQAKTGFLANLSHELRGPLGIILNSIEILHDGLLGDVNDDQKETLTMAKESGQHLLDLVNDVLDYAKVEAGKVTATPVEIPVNALLEDLSNVVRSQANNKNHKLTLEPVVATLGIMCDKRHSRQILINFLTNAIKYTPDGGTITVSANKAAQGLVRISVKDSGIGIPEDQRHKVFNAFERVDNEYALKQVGTGLGMPLTKKLAEVNGGGVGFDSEAGKGSTFWVALPEVEIVEPSKEDSTQKGEEVVDGKGEGILLVDHDISSRDMMKLFLDKRGFRVYSAESAQEVINILRDENIELALIENDIPDLPGEEMVSQIRSSPKGGSLPIVLLSARAFVFDIERFLKLGVDRCLSKPVPLAELAHTARRLIDEYRNLNL